MMKTSGTCSLPKMRKGRPHIEFDLSLLEKLVDDESSCVNVQRLPHHIALHPFHLHNLGNSVKELLNADIAKYNTKWDGILCGYKNVKYLSRLGRIVDDSCYVHRDIEADFFIFKPEVGKTLQGIVNKMSKDHVGCLVHKLFNVTLPKPKHSSSNWLGCSVSLKSEILLTVTETNFEDRLPFIKGEITSVLSNPDQDESQFDPSLGDEENLPTVEKKLPKKIYFNDEEDEVEESEESPKKKKSKKKKKSEAEKDESLPQSEFEEDSPHEKKSKKRKKSMSEKELLDEVQELEHKEESLDMKESRKRKKSFVEAEIGEAPAKKKSKKSKKSDLLDYSQEENILEFLRDE